MALRFIARAFVSTSILILCWYGQPEGFARDKCQTFVKYSERSIDISFPTFKAFSLGKLATKPELRAASDVAQLLDFYQYTTCVQLEKIRADDPHYDDIVRERMQATDRLATLIVFLYANSKPSATSKPDNPSAKDPSDFDEFISQAALTARAALKLAGTQDGKKVMDSRKQWQFDPTRIDQTLSKAPAKNSASPVRPWEATPIRPWELIPKQKREMVIEQLQVIVLALKGPLNGFDEDKLRTYVWMPAGDGHLQVPDEPTLATEGSHPRLNRERIKIPIGYGFTGVAYEQKTEQYGCLPGETVRVEFTMGVQEEESQARRVLLEAKNIRWPTAKWIIAVPLRNPKDDNEVVAVLSISSDENPKGFPENCHQDSWREWKTRLEHAYQGNRGAIDNAIQKIEDLLTLSYSDASQ